MDIHKNARLTPLGREALAQKVLGRQGTLTRLRQSKSAPAPPPNGRVVIRPRDGRLSHRSSRPHRRPRATSPALLDRVIELRRQCTPGYQIAQRSGLSPATVSRILQPRSSEPLAPPASTSAGDPLRAPPAGRSAAPRYQGINSLSAGFSARRRPTPRPAPARRLRRPARRHR